jgi:hypothetical protein
MRLALLGTVALVFSAPAFAAEAPSRASQDAQVMAERLNDPATQQAMTGTLDALIGAMLDMRLDGIAKALEPMNGGKKIKMHGRTVREMAARDDPRFEQKLHGNTRAMVGSMGALASALATMMPELEQAMNKMGDAMDKAQDRLPDTH